MKKNVECHHCVQQWLKKVIQVMRIVCFLMMLGLTSVYANSFSQRKVSLDVQNQTLLHVLDQLQEQSGYTFLFSSEDVRGIKGISLKATREELFDVLKKCLQGTGISFEVNNELVILRKEQVKRDSVIKNVQLVGKVTDMKKIPMPGVTVKLVGTSVGTATNSKGIFSLNLPVLKGTLEFSFVGYKTQKMNFTQATRDTLHISLEEEIQALDETVVVAYGSTTRRESTGAISVVKADEIKGIPSPTIASLLQGRVAGMDVTNMSGAPGGGGTVVTIRGYNSLDVEQGRRFSNPLWVVDGVPLNSFTSPVTGTNLLSDINPDMIESIQILKDASSAAIYGSRAANGVIIVTTKKGRKNQDANFSVNISQTWGILPRLPAITLGRGERLFRLKALMNNPVSYLNKEDNIYKYPTTYDELYANQNSSMDYFFKVSPYSSMNGLFLQDSLNDFYNNATNYFPLYYETGKVTNVNVQSYGGSERISYGIGLGYYDESGVLKGSGFKRLSLNANMSIDPVKKMHVDLRFDASMTNRKRSDPSTQVPSVEVVPGDPYKLSSLLPGDDSEMWAATLERNRGADEKNRSIRVRGSFRISYDILEGLNFSTSASADYSSQRKNLFMPSYMSVEKYSLSQGITGINLMGLNENLLSFKRTFNDHSFNAVAGLSYQYDQIESNDGSAENSPSDKIHYAPGGFPTYDIIQSGSFQNVRVFQHYTSDMQEKALISYFGRLEYNYKKKYLVSISFRRDGSSVFGKKNKWGTFPSVAAGWTFTEENFTQKLPWLSFGKIRASWGRSGMHFSQNYLALGLIQSGPVFQGDGTLEPVWTDGLYNDKLSWEETDQYDFGLDLDLLNYRLGITIDYYYRYTDKLLNKVGIPGGYQGNYAGFYSQWRNAAAISNEGLELMIKYEIFREQDLYWKVSVNGAKNWNRFEKSYDGRDLDGRIIGKALNGVYAFETDGFINKQEEMPLYYNAAGVGKYLSSGNWDNSFYKPGDYKYRDINGNGIIDGGDAVYQGSALPLVSGGLVSEFRWRNIDINLSFAYQLGRHIIDLMKTNSILTGITDNELSHPILFNTKDVTFWEKPGDNHADYSELKLNRSMGTLMTDRMVEKVNWLKMKTLSIGYTLPKKLVEKWGLDEIRIFGSGENLFTITNYSGMDPETVDISLGIDEGMSYPLARKFTLGLTLKF